MKEIYRKWCWMTAVAVLAMAGAMKAVQYLPPGQKNTAPQFEPTQKQTEICTEEILTLPFTIPGTGLVAEQITQYSGPYFEDGSDEPVENTAALMVYNHTDEMVEFGGIALEQGGEVRHFFVYCLPPRSRCLVLEKSRKCCSAEEITDCRSLGVYWGRADTEVQQLKIEVSDSCISVQNRTGQMQKQVSVRYKNYVPEGQYYLGGICYSACIPELWPYTRLDLEPGHMESGSIRIVTVMMDEK